MPLMIHFISRQAQKSDYDWADISKDEKRVGKARCKMEPSKITIYSINIYPEFERAGYGKKFVEYCKTRFRMVVADRVRPTAVGFWKAMGFHDNKDGNWVYEKNATCVDE